MSRLLQPERPSPAAYALLVLAAVAVAVGGFEHARLFHRGYAEVDVVGPLFLLNGVASAVVIALLVLDRVALFVAGALLISVASLASILVSHSSSFFGFAEGGYDAGAKLIVIAEVAAVVLTLAGAAAAGLRPGPTRPEATA
ncbi:MAG: hypothetical protein QOH43_2940 [Solirubrobacteraceae bacterium]|jgi:hypothetical protein|nr:hypothetical protein [Solirubrobacteraceae bacterium]